MNTEVILANYDGFLLKKTWVIEPLKRQNCLISSKFSRTKHYFFFWSKTWLWKKKDKLLLDVFQRIRKNNQTAKDPYNYVNLILNWVFLLNTLSQYELEMFRTKRDFYLLKIITQIISTHEVSNVWFSGTLNASHYIASNFAFDSLEIWLLYVMRCHVAKWRKYKDSNCKLSGG